VRFALRPVIEDAHVPPPAPSVVQAWPITGVGFHHQATPFWVIAQPPSSVTVPPEVASK